MSAVLECRSCGAPDLQLVLSLGSMPLANALITAEQLDQPESTYPLELAFCPQCSLVQITETVPPEELFRDYLYFSSFSDTMLSHAQAIVEGVLECLRQLLKPGGVAIIEVPYVKDLIDRCEFDTIYHEHLCYFSLTALNQLFERHGLAISWVERLDIHGGSLRIFVGVD